MEILSIIYAVLVTYYAVDTKIELNDLKEQPPRIITEIKIQEVFIPVAAECPVADKINKPELMIHILTDEERTDISKLRDAYVISLSQCMSYAEEQESILDGYRNLEQ